MKKNDLFLQLDNICFLLYSQQYSQTETQLLYLIKKIIKYALENYDVKKRLIDFHTVLYRSFNQYYLDWHKKNNLRITSFMQYHNYLLARCSHPAEIDDLIFELGEYLKHNNQKNEVLYHLKCYRNNTSCL